MGRLGISELFLLLIVISIYFLPTIIGRKKQNFNAILLLNLFLGWTFIGWILSLIWAVSKEKEVIVINSNNSTADELQKLKQLLDDGALSKDEFETEKKVLLRK
ncbi:superinfection immunity protein [Flavobacterium sp. 5]|uniref:superinfection immunity protein n=1 Tax=Flavobacterium sp. 5 TaxID=2035199 RepID=UPI000C2C6B5B|nr:superinfection immunity protein [Flavobacterium sp. 5]PKB16715.1 putative oligomerization/nucleic acid binding protein [Flavobacterium sp. 5]